MNNNTLNEKADMIWSLLNTVQNCKKTKEDQLELIKPLLIEIAESERVIGRAQILNHFKNEISILSSDVKNIRDEQDDRVFLSDTIEFIDWVSDKSYKRCINGEWIQLGTGEYNTIVGNTMELYQLFKKNFK